MHCFGDHLDMSMRLVIICNLVYFLEFHQIIVEYGVLEKISLGLKFIKIQPCQEEFNAGKCYLFLRQDTQVRIVKYCILNNLVKVFDTNIIDFIAQQMKYIRNCCEHEDLYIEFIYVVITRNIIGTISIIESELIHDILRRLSNIS